MRASCRVEGSSGDLWSSHSSDQGWIHHCDGLLRALPGPVVNVSADVHPQHSGSLSQCLTKPLVKILRLVPSNKFPSCILCLGLLAIFLHTSMKTLALSSLRPSTWCVMIAISVFTFSSLGWMSLDLLPVLLLIWLRMWLAFITAGVHQNLLFRDTFSTCPITWGCSLPAAGLCICP